MTNPWAGFAARYRAAEQAHGACPIESGHLLKLADNECEHGRLAGDSTPPCGCWPSEPPIPVPTTISRPNQAPALTIEEAQALTDQTPAQPEAPEAPYGYKADGTPRKRPAPPPDRIARARAARAAKQNGESAAPIVTQADAEGLLERIAQETEDELAAADERVRDLRAQLQAAEAEYAALLDARRGLLRAATKPPRLVERVPA
jgi:hypothetical protein